MRRRQHRTRVRDIAQRREIGGAEVVAQEQRGDHRHDRQAGDALLRHQLQHQRRIHERPLEHDAGAGLEGQEQLVEPVVERERQNVEDDVALGVPQVAVDRGRGRDDVRVRQHDALRAAGGTRGVDQRGQVEIDHRRGSRRGVRVHERLERYRPFDPPRFGRRCARHARQYHRRAIRQPRQRLVQHRHGALVGNQHARRAIGQHVGQLVGLGRRVDRNEDGAGAQRAENREHRLDAVVEVDGDAIAADHAEAREPRGHARHLAVQLAVRQPASGAHERLGVGPALGGRSEERINQQPAPPARQACGSRTTPRSARSRGSAAGAPGRRC